MWHSTLEEGFVRIVKGVRRNTRRLHTCVCVLRSKVKMAVSTTLSSAAKMLESEHRFLTIGGVETMLLFDTDFELRNMASFETLFSPEWSAKIAQLLKSFGQVAKKYKKWIIFDTQTWRASKHWYDVLGIGEEERERVVDMAVEHVCKVAEEVEKESGGEIKVVVFGVLGPRADGYLEDKGITVESAREYHRDQVGKFKEAGVGVVAAMTLTSSTEGVGVAKEVKRSGLKCIISFTMDTKGFLPNGEGLGQAIERVDKEVGEEGVSFYMVNCVHPKYVRMVVERALEKGEEWVKRFKGIRGNASDKTHEELDGCEELDEGVPDEWAKESMEIVKLLPWMKVVGGCCGTGVRHCEEIAKLLG